jgi:excisionase family DNA binding protein
MDISNLLTIANFCQTVGISRSTWHKLKRNHMTPAIVAIGGIQRIRQEAVEEWLAENEKKVSVGAPTGQAKARNRLPYNS